MKVPNFKLANALTTYGINSKLAALIIVVDWVLFGGEFFTFALDVPIYIGVSILLGVISWIWQWKGSKDSCSVALLKGVIIGAITAIPSPLTTILAGITLLLPQNKDTKD